MWRSRIQGTLLLAVSVLVLLGLTVLATMFAALTVNDTYIGVLLAEGRGTPGTYVVTQVSNNFGKVSSSGTFTSDDGQVVVADAKYPGGDNELGAAYPVRYLPSLRTGRLPEVVSTGTVGDVAISLVFALLATPFAVIGWVLLVMVILGLARGSGEADAVPMTEVEPTQRGVPHLDDGAE